jgi:hypothetical protein
MRDASLALAACFVIACGPPPRNGGDDNTGADSNGGSGDDGSNGCASETKLVYTIDQFDNRLSQFDPSTRTFHDLGSLACPTMAGATPFSMSVDRNGFAWVLYNSGELFNVSITSLICAKTTWASPNNMKVFGMGFSTDQAGGTAETLFIGGGLTQTQASFTLAKIDTATLGATTIASEPALPEMTGNSNAELWGFFTNTTTAHVVQFDKATGGMIHDFPEPTLAGTNTGYAFAHWGGDYWVFLIKNAEPSTSVYQVDGVTGLIKTTTPTTGRTIVGAGVSTCAPVVIE